MFNTNTIKETKRRINLTINPTVYRTFSEIAEKRLQPKSWIIESMMKNYITSNKQQRYSQINKVLTLV